MALTHQCVAKTVLLSTHTAQRRSAAVQLLLVDAEHESFVLIRGAFSTVAATSAVDHGVVR